MDLTLTEVFRLITKNSFALIGWMPQNIAVVQAFAIDKPNETARSFSSLQQRNATPTSKDTKHLSRSIGNIAASFPKWTRNVETTSNNS
jgi:hypothetical protein